MKQCVKCDILAVIQWCSRGWSVFCPQCKNETGLHRFRKEALREWVKINVLHNAANEPRSE